MNMIDDKVTILAVDDVSANLAAIEALLTDSSVVLLKAASGAEALELLLVHDVALALLDVQMPGMDGFELAALMRGTQKTRGVPIIFLTAVATDERRKFRGYETGAVDYLFKPIDPQILRSKVDVFVELYQQRRELALQRDKQAETLARLQAHRDNSPLALVEFDADLRIISWSRGAQRLFGWRTADVSGFRASDFEWLDSADIHAFTELVNRMIIGQQANEIKRLTMRTIAGNSLDCECYCSALISTQGDLISVNIQILDVTDRVRAEAHQQLLMGELNHRVKNTLASVQAIATQTLRHSSGPSDFAPTFIGRIHSLARAHSLLSNTTWQGASLRDLIDGQLDIGTVDLQRLQAAGPDVDLPPEPALHLALVLHEIMTNAHKYGALSTPAGRVDVHWALNNEEIKLVWTESGGPPVSPPTRKGFGTTLIERSLNAEGGRAEPNYRPDGLIWTITMPHKFRSISNSPAPKEEKKFASSMDDASPLSGKRILIIEDEPLVALEICQILEDAGATAMGPVATRQEALAAITADLDGALLDGNLHGESVDEIAAALGAQGVPFLFVSGYGRDHLPAGFANTEVLGKPFSSAQLRETTATLVCKG